MTTADVLTILALAFVAGVVVGSIQGYFGN